MFRKPKPQEPKVEAPPKPVEVPPKPQVFISGRGPRIMHARMHDLDSADHPNIYVINPINGEVLTYSEALQKWINQAVAGMMQHGNEWHDPDFSEITHTHPQLHNRLHALDSALDHSGVITDTQHGVRTLANAHAHSHLSGIGPDDHHNRLHALDSIDDHSGIYVVNPQDYDYLRYYTGVGWFNYAENLMLCDTKSPPNAYAEGQVMVLLPKIPTGWYWSNQKLSVAYLIDHTKAIHDALDINADTLDGKHLADIGHQVQSVIQTSNVSTSNPNFEDIANMSITLTTGANKVLIIFSCSAYIDANSVSGNSRLLIDGVVQDAGSSGLGIKGKFGVPLATKGYTYGGNTEVNESGPEPHTHPFWVVIPGDIAIGILDFATVKTLTAGSHTIKVQWRSDASTGMYCRAATGYEHMVLIVIELKN